MRIFELQSEEQAHSKYAGIEKWLRLIFAHVGNYGCDRDHTRFQLPKIGRVFEWRNLLSMADWIVCHFHPVCDAFLIMMTQSCIKIYVEGWAHVSMRRTRTLPKIIFFFFCYNQKPNRISVGSSERKQKRCVMMSSKYFSSLSLIDFKQSNPDSPNSPRRYYSDSCRSPDSWLSSLKNGIGLNYYADVNGV